MARDRYNELGVSLLLIVLLAGCKPSMSANPSFQIDGDLAETAIEQMHENPLEAERPVLILSGFGDVGIQVSGVASVIRRGLIDESAVHTIAFFGERTFDECRDKVLDYIEREFPRDKTGGGEPIEFDVIAVSMGGLVARHSARAAPARDNIDDDATDSTDVPTSSDIDSGGESSDDQPSRRLRIARLFTIATPHQGARMAGLPTWDARHKAMRDGSDFLNELNEDASSYDFPIFAYVRLGDQMVGPENAVPPRGGVWWLENKPLAFAHLTAARDRRILADIMRRLRGETPFTTDPPEPLPRGE